MPTTSGRFQILTLDGGGVKALFTAHVLAALEEDSGISITESFDLISGTSAGGIIALALGAGLRPAEIVERYGALAETVFPAAARSRWRLPRRLFRTTYDQAPLREALTAIVGDRILGDSSTRLVIPTWDLQNDSVHVFKTPHDERLKRDWRVPMVDVALATSAAPTFLPAAQVGHHRLIDGGVWANNPSAVAVVEAHAVLGVPLEAVRVLNIGTTSPVTSVPTQLDRAGLLRWGRAATRTLLAASSRGAAGMAELLIRPNFQRVDADVTDDQFTIDSADPQALAGLASHHSRHANPRFDQLFAGHTAAPYTPLYSREAPPSPPTARRAP